MMKKVHINWLKKAFLSTVLIWAMQPNLHAQTQTGRTARLQAMQAKLAPKRKADTLLVKQQMPLAHANMAEKFSPVAASKTAQPVYYTFTGTGSWLAASNWQNNRVPPATLKAGDHIVIDTKGACLFNNKNLFLLAGGSSLEVKKGAALYVSIGNHFIVRDGTFINNGTVTILSGKANFQPSTAGTGTIQATGITGIRSKKQ